MEEPEAGHGSSGHRRSRTGSYVVWMSPGPSRPGRHGAQHRRRRLQPGSASSTRPPPPGATATCGVRTSSRSRGTRRSPRMTNRVTKPGHLPGGVEPGTADRYALKIDSPTAVRAPERGSSTAERPRSSRSRPFTTPEGETLPAGSADLRGRLGDEGPARLDRAGRRVCGSSGSKRPSSAGARRRSTAYPRIAVLTGRGQPGRLDAPEPRLRGRPGLDCDSEHRARPIRSRATTSSTTPPATRRRRSRPARARLTAFFAAGGGYVGAGANGAAFPHDRRAGHGP